MKVYTKRYSNSGPATASPAISIPAGQLACVKVPMNSEGKITNLVVDQVSGTSIGFTVELLDSVVPYPVGNSAYNIAPADSISHYRIVPQQVVAAGNVYEFDDDDPGYPYINTDGDSTNNQRCVYLIIIPNNVGVTTVWRATITSVSDVS